MSLLAGALLLALAAAVADAGPDATKQSFEKKITKTVGARYLLFLPRGYAKESQKRWPLILFLHGAGERGDDVERVKIHGVIKVAEKQPDFPFIVVAPQCPEDSWWDRQIDTLTALLDEILADYKVDPDRVYVTGLSMGGFGAWALAIEHPERFAAIAPICGRGNPFAASRLKDLPAWVFHGAKDTVVPIRYSEEMVASIKACGGDVKFTVYPDAEHDSWTETYNNPELYKWFLQHKRSKK